uniref:Cilia and flagella associated protein 54 n=1 Tax=Anser cygnoides TaxID=8845 RepID=A0A8B9E231_ANSCY
LSQEPGLRLRGLPPAGPRRGRHVPGQSRCPCPLLGDAAAPRPGRSMAEPPPAAFYGAVAPGNPVVDSLEAELRDVLGFLRRLRGAGEAEPHANTLFNIWNKYKPRLPDWYYNDKLLKVGDSLVQIKEYKLALRQCYGRYLQQFSSVNPDDVTDDVHKFKSTFFPNGFRDKNAAFTLHALQERTVCIYQMVCSNDRNLQNQESLKTCFNVLSSLRLTMQVALPQENLCWLIYNGTIHIYTICRHLMMIGQSAKVLEYLLWASICMELSIPLLSVHYLTWRATLYAAVSQCYFDCQAGIHGEVFARRGLIKIDELKQLENISSSQENSETKKIFREATLKMSVMIFKRAVYESRRKPKSYFRPKLRFSLKEAQNLSWPRTTTERLLTEMFDCTAAQFLAILEALSDSSRHVLRPAPPVPDEIEIRDVISELFFAGLEILSGNSIKNQKECWRGAQTSVFEKGVPGDAAVKFVKLAFSYEEWDVFDSAVEFVTNFLQAQDDPRWKKAEIELKLLTLMQPLLFPRKFRCGFSDSEANTREARICKMNECIQTGFEEKKVKQNMQPDKEILFDVITFLWQKCKTGLQQIQTSGSGYFQYIHKYKACKWVYVLWIINEVIQKSNIADIDVVMVIEVTLNLTAILENIADSTSESKKKAGKAFNKKVADIIGKIKKNKLSRAIFLMQKAAQIFPEELTTSSQKRLLEEALTLIEQVEAEQSALYHSLKKFMNVKKKSRTPPPPILLCRSHCSMTFKPAPFSSDVQVSWYSILGCVAGGSNTKVRLNNNKLPNAGEEIPADGKSVLEIQGLDPNEKYIFAVAAYSSDGKLIGDAIGETTKPILAYPPLSATTVRAYLTQVAYQTGNYTLAREAFSPTWDYFVSNSSPLPANTAVISARSNLTISENRLRLETVSQTSPITLYLFLRNIFAICDINVMKGGLFCDSVCSNEILYKEQAGRLAECERMTVAIDLGNWLNDASYTLQSVVQCYGLLAPIIYHKISAVPVVQILIKCLAVLQEIPSAILQRRQAGCYESIQHMIACTSFYTAKVLRSWKEYELAVIITNYGKNLLDPSQTASLRRSGATETEETHTNKEEFSSLRLWFHVEFLFYTVTTCHNGFDFFIDVVHGSELTGQEDPLFLYPIISCWTSNTAYREVMKFKNKSRFLEFFIQVLHKILNEEKVQNVLEWSGNVQAYLKRLFLKSVETSALKKPEASALKKQTQETLSPIRKRQTLRQYFVKHPDIMKSPEAQRKHKEELRKVAHRTLVVLLKPIVSNYLNRKKFHQICLEEMPWRSQMNIYLAIAHYHLFKKKLEEQYNIGICELWNYTQESQSIAKHSHSHMDAFPITKEFLRNTIWLPFYLASDMIIDMITELQANDSLKIVDPEGDFCIPSCLGGITDENGGSNLHPQSPLDDVNVVDLKWICNLVLKTIELLYQMKKWEALVHIAVQFNIFTHERYTEQVIPLLVYAQRQLLERKQQFSSPDSHESHFIKYLSDNANKVNFKFLFWILTLNMKNDYTGGSQAKRLVYVPLDVNDTLKCFRETLKKSKFHSRALRHSRKLLSLFLAHTQGILEKNNQRDLKVQALHELGNLHFYAGNKRAAFKYWCQALDETLNIADALNNWQKLGFPKNAKDCFAIGRSTDISQKFISQAGIWGCLLAAVLVAKIAQYITTSNMRLRTKHCYLSAILFKTLFRASLPHPTSDCDFAQYEMNMLIPGIDLFSDRYRADVSTVVASLNFLMFELHCAKHNLIILPLFTLHQYFVSEICKDPAKCIEGRIFKIKVLTDIGFFMEAFHELSLLNCGERIPWKIPSGYRKTEQMKALQRFDSSKSLLTVTNLQVLEDIFNWSLSLTMLPLCNQQIMNKLTLAKMHFIICLSATINTIPEKVEKHIYSADNEPSGVTASNVKGNYKGGGKVDVFCNLSSIDFCAEDGQLPHSTIAQDHMNMHLWLRCRKMLVTALVTQIHGIGYMEGITLFWFSVIKEVIIEAEAFGDIETQAEMMVQAAILDLQERCPMAGIKLLQIFLCGESIEQQIEDSTLTCLVLPAKNIYLPHINLLTQVKMRIGRTLAEKVACTPERVDPLQWLHALKHLESALELCRESAKKELDIEAELLFQIGKYNPAFCTLSHYSLSIPSLLQVLLLYAYNTKPIKISNIKIFSSMSVFSGHLWVPLARQFWELIHLTKFFFFFPLTCQIPFDVTLQSISTLEGMFDPASAANGCTITEESLFRWIISLFH